MNFSWWAVLKFMNIISIQERFYAESFVLKKETRSMAHNIISQLEEIALDTSVIIQKGMKLSLNDKGTEVSQPTVSGKLKVANITRKYCLLISTERNSLRIIENFLKNAISLNHLNRNKIAYIDETVLNMRTGSSADIIWSISKLFRQSLQTRVATLFLYARYQSIKS